jgi:outer membrane receptor protein involved in Fe transport
MKTLLMALLVFLMVFPLVGQQVTISGQLKDKNTQEGLAFVNLLLKKAKDSSFVTGTLSTEEGRFSLPPVKPGQYLLIVSHLGYQALVHPVYVGQLSAYLDLSILMLIPQVQTLSQVEVKGQREEVEEALDKKTYSLDKNLSQSGGSVLQAMQNLPGITVQDGQLQLRGSNKIAVLVDGKQTALTGFGSQSGLDNIPASAIERIEIIQNPSSRYDANGNAGIVNIVFRKSQQEGFNGKASLTTGLGALWIKEANLPTIRPQFQGTPKVNPSLSVNYRRKNLNTFLGGDVFYNPTLNKNEFVTRTYGDGTVIRQQTKRNRRTTFSTLRGGFDYNPSQAHSFSFSGLLSSEKILDDGDEPFFNADLSVRNRLWQFLEDELKTTLTLSSSYQYHFPQPGHLLQTGFNYTFHRENEKYFFTNIYPDYTGKDAFKLLSDENVTDLTADYIRPLPKGRLEAGLKYRWRFIPTQMTFYPGLNSPLDTNAGGGAVYNEHIPAVYGNYVLETPRFELEAGLRVEYVEVYYKVDPGHNTYRSDGYSYFQPFPNLRLSYKLGENDKFSFFFNRRVDRPNEFDIRVFPKYDDAEIIKVGNPALRPQFTTSFELGYKHGGEKGYFYGAVYHRAGQGTLTRIASTAPGSTLIYNVMQNAGASSNTGLELVLSKELSRLFGFNLSANGYYNRIEAFSVLNLYPVPTPFSAPADELFSGNLKGNGFFHLPAETELQLTALYLAPDLVPQGRIGTRFSLDVGLKKKIQQGKGELLFNATDLLNTMVIERNIRGSGFSYVSKDYYETQVIRLGYSRKF